ncbi:hypothetical protein M409DRAFT_57802 [Zasmidium cellare ATCC 36951]|uniref:BTB domain-containing protein n=1 Tax=Zasmidium cellare ATCC 36951 TaxID=1080233 RepID=A0A6A6C7W8_ZASCE|nr:uncharacterized protein M409DRAFT_57802 [Zasmidium cellare ATCC 36951]KAF2163135.1 hypothetical protein M409DRAFT_57802 [Zasmidium cellare ATCC 36951]
MAPKIKQESPGPPPKRSKHNYADTCKVIVGSRKDEFVMHTAFATAKSSFFKSTISQDWKEGKEKTVRLPQHEAGTFHVFVHWIYSGSLDFSIVDNTGAHDPPSYLNCGRVWALAHYLGAPQLQNQVIDRIIHKVARGDTRNVALSSLKHIWQITPPGSTIRQLLTNCVASENRAYNGVGEAEELPEEILLEATRQHLYGASKNVPTMEHRCNYHEHDEGEPRCE